MAALSCPRCEGRPLAPLATPSGAPLHRCPQCRGLWCARAQLVELLEVTAAHPLVAREHPSATRSESACPTCRDTCLDAVRPSTGSDLAIGHCPACDGVWLDVGVLPQLKALAVAPRPRALPPAAPIPPPSAAPIPIAAEGFQDRFSFDDPLVNGLAVPLALLVALLVRASPFGGVLHFFINMPFHEVGHATVAWFSGHYAVPLPFYTDMRYEERSALVAMSLAALLLAGVFAGLRERRYYLVWLGGAGLLLQAIFTVFTRNTATLRWSTWSGCGGEILWSTLLIVTFYHRLPDGLRWDFTRFLALGAGTFGLVEALGRWREIARDPGYLPFGTALGGADDSNGDMDRLVQWGWTREQIVHSYLWLGYACLVVVAVHYAVFLVRARRASRAGARAPSASPPPDPR